MDNELAVIEETEVQPSPRLHAVAVNATEMAAANTEIRSYVEVKIAALAGELADVRESMNIAAEKGWAPGALERMEKRLSTQKLYYEKLVMALDAGYTLVPNMPCDQFAIRVSRTRPEVKAIHRHSDYGKPNGSMRDEREQLLPAGEGRYESPIQTINTTRATETLDGGKTTRWHVTIIPTGFAAIDFPLAAAVPVVMTATQAAMALRLFDRIGIVPQSVRRDADPIVLGQIVRRWGSRERVTSFLIAWHLDLRTL
jgi:hypothetical protein